MVSVIHRIYTILAFSDGLYIVWSRTLASLGFTGSPSLFKYSIKEVSVTLLAASSFAISDYSTMFLLNISITSMVTPT